MSKEKLLEEKKKLLKYLNERLEYSAYGKSDLYEIEALEAEIAELEGSED